MKSVFRLTSGYLTRNTGHFFGMPFIFVTFLLTWDALLIERSENWLLIVPVAFFVALTWLWRSFLVIINKREKRRFVMLVPYTLAFCSFLAMTNAPMWLHFWWMKPSLEQARQNRAISTEYNSNSLPMIQRAKSGRAIRVIIWKNDTSFLGYSATFHGYAYCPETCQGGSFDQIKDEYTETDDPSFQHLEGNWYRTSHSEWSRD